MSCVKLPEGICDELVKHMAAFWWGEGKGKRKIHWLSWNKLCEKKDGGGLGFRDPSCLNLALLAKQGWRLITNEGSLVQRVLKAKYFSKVSFFEAKVGSNPS